MIALNYHFKLFFYITLIFVLPISINFGQTHTVNYSIPQYNASGSFTFETGSYTNQNTNQEESYLKICLPDGKTIEIDSKKIDLIINIIENKTNKIAFNERKLNIKSQNDEKVLNRLKELRTLFVNNAFGNKTSKPLNELESTFLNWEHTLQTVRGIQVYVTGTVD